MYIYRYLKNTEKFFCFYYFSVFSAKQHWISASWEALNSWAVVWGFLALVGYFQVHKLHLALESYVSSLRTSCFQGKTEKLVVCNFNNKSYLAQVYPTYQMSVSFSYTTHFNSSHPGSPTAVRNIIIFLPL